MTVNYVYYESIYPSRPIGQGVFTDSLKFSFLHIFNLIFNGGRADYRLDKYESFSSARYARPFYVLRAGHPRNCLTAVLGVARQQGGRPADVFYPLSLILESTGRSRSLTSD
jgi:hypothetical protein